MAYVKLDTGILESTLWVDRDGREVFLTALLMAQPREIREPMAQIAVRDLEPTGFVVPPGWYGHIDAAGIGILRRAGVDTDAGMAALERLGAPDVESRTTDFEGRRMVRVNGGWLMLNFMAYRDKDHTGAERARRYRDRKKTAAEPEPSRRDVALQGRDVTQADADADANTEDQKTTPTRPASLACPHADIIALYHAILPEGREVREWTGQRESWLRARWRGSKERQSLVWWTAYFNHVRNSDFLMGKIPGRNGGKPFEVSLEWLVNESNLVNVMEGKYHG